MEKISKAVSYIFHPLLVPSLGMLVIFNSGTYLSYLPYDMKKWILIIVFLCTYIVPLAFIRFLYYLGSVRSMQMSERKERYIPLAISSAIYFFCYYLLKRVSLPGMYHSFILSSMITVLVLTLVTLKYKISIHMAGIGGLTALIAFIAFSMRVDLQFYLGISLIFAGIIGSARLRLEAHTADQVYIGFLLGFSTVLLVLVLS